MRIIQSGSLRIYQVMSHTMIRFSWPYYLIFSFNAGQIKNYNSTAARNFPENYS
jgi:hypothetical protein